MGQISLVYSNYINSNSDTVLGFGTATGTHIVARGVETTSAARHNLSTDLQNATQSVTESMPVLENARGGVGTTNDTGKVSEGVATWSKKGDGLEHSKSVGNEIARPSFFFPFSFKYLTSCSATKMTKATPEPTVNIAKAEIVFVKPIDLSLPQSNVG